MNPEFWKDKKVVVTGARGFVGANLCRRLVELGAHPVGVDLKHVPVTSLWALEVNAYQMAGDVLELGDMMIDVVQQQQPDVIFHLAGMGHIADCQKDPFGAFRSHVFGTLNMLEAMRLKKSSAVIVVASSNHAYVGGIQQPGKTFFVGGPRREGGGYGMREEMPLQAIDVYGSAKAMADQMVRVYREAYGLRAAALRHVNSYGPADPHETHLVTGSILACLKGERPKLRSDGRAVKAYLHVDDVVSAYLTVAEKVDTLFCHAVNVTAPECEAPALAVARAVMEAAGMDGGPEVLNQDSSQQGYEERLDASLIRGLGWAPQYSLYQGIAKTYEWYREHGGMRWRDGS